MCELVDAREWNNSFMIANECMSVYPLVHQCCEQVFVCVYLLVRHHQKKIGTSPPIESSFWRDTLKSVFLVIFVYLLIVYIIYHHNSLLLLRLVDRIHWLEGQGL